MDIVGRASENNDTSNAQENRNNNQSTNSNSSVDGRQIDLLRSIDSTVKQILRQGATMSQSDARNMMPGRNYSSYNRASTRTGYSNDEKWGPNRRNAFSNGLKSDSTRFKGVVDEFEDGLREALMESIFGSGFKDNIIKHLQAFEDELGVNLLDVPKALGKDLMKSWVDSAKKNNPFVQNAYKKVSDIKNSAVSTLQFRIGQGMAEYDRNNGTAFSNKFADMLRNGTSSSTSASTANARRGNGSNNLPSTYDTSSGANSANISIDQYELLLAITSNVEIIAQFARLQMSNKDKWGGALEENEIPEVTKLASLKDQALAASQENAPDIVGNLVDGQGLDAVVAGIKNVGANIITDFGPQLITAAGTAAVALGAVMVAGYLLEKGLDTLTPAVEGTKQLFESMKKSGNRYQNSRKENLEKAKKRLEEDVTSMVEAPFKILEDAAQSWYDAWDSNLRTISGTQGYSKDDLYALMGGYADRLRNEGLTSVISSADITTNLSKVLESGLSGKVAEEFAYLATKLNAAVPTQDFFSYGETYASIAANAIKNGQSEAEAIAYANEQLELFASNVLYASRELAGGFSSGLKDAQSLFADSVQIANASKVGVASEISGVLTSVASIVGSVAPDLSTGIVEAVVKAATGGNSSEYVALRSLAGVNASNTEFLRLLSQDPQRIFTELFSNLSKMQNMAPEAYMEVAEGLSSIFGIHMEAFQRVDFNYLAQAISQMNVNNASLSDNIELLASGETTTTAEQLKMQKINEYMLEEGLSYVLDNQVARSIQEHMWDEQLAREIMESTYAVELQGSALAFLEGISQTVENIINFLNPFSFIKQAVNLTATAVEGVAQRSDIRQLLELGKVGNGNAKDLYNLTTYNADLKLTSSLVDMMGGFSTYRMIDSVLDTFNKYTTATGTLDILRNGNSAIRALVQASSSIIGSSSSRNGFSSRYSWGTVGKSTNALLSSLTFSDTSAPVLQQVSSTSAASLRAENRFQEFVDSMKKFVENDQSYDEWKSSATKYGIQDFDTALEEYGRSESELKGAFQSYEAQKASKYQSDRDASEDSFWEQGIMFWTVTHPDWTKQLSEYQETLITNQISQIGHLQTISEQNRSFFYTFLRKWEDEFETHSNYNPELKASDVKEIQNAEKDEYGDAVLALANALTANSVDLKDPAVQTNVLLSKILLVIEAIMQQNNTSGGGALPTALAALGLGITQKV